VHWPLYSQQNCSTQSQYTGSIPLLWSTTRGTLECISHYVIYKTTTNINCFAARTPVRLMAQCGVGLYRRRLFLSWDVSWNCVWKHDLRLHLFSILWPIQCKNFIILINLCVKISYYILMQKISISLNPVKAVSTIFCNSVNCFHKL
jgi:hypothetical protein